MLQTWNIPRICVACWGKRGYTLLLYFFCSFMCLCAMGYEVNRLLLWYSLRERKEVYKQQKNMHVLVKVTKCMLPLSLAVMSDIWRVSAVHITSLLVRFRMVMIYSALTQSERLNLGDCGPCLLMFPSQPHCTQVQAARAADLCLFMRASCFIRSQSFMRLEWTAESTPIQFISNHYWGREGWKHRQFTFPPKSK